MIFLIEQIGHDLVLVVGYYYRMASAAFVIKYTQYNDFYLALMFIKINIVKSD